eukprot:1160909-Pelagomonas_calceolata.AAC.5
MAVLEWQAVMPRLDQMQLCRHSKLCICNTLRAAPEGTRTKTVGTTAQPNIVKLCRNSRKCKCRTPRRAAE